MFNISGEDESNKTSSAAKSETISDSKPENVKPVEVSADDAAISAMKSEIEKLEEMSKSSKRKIAALNLDNEIKDRKIQEL